LPQQQPLLRQFSLVDFELRSSAEGRIIEGYAVPYGEWTTIREPMRTYKERFQNGAFAGSVADRAERIKLLLNHDHQVLPVGRSLALREEPRGLFAQFLVARNAEGEALMGLVQDRIVDSFSVSFRPVKDTLQDGVYTTAS
jgi:HK97 family phage prohead protease